MNDWLNEWDQLKYSSPLWGWYENCEGLSPYYKAPGIGQTAKHKPQPVQSWLITGLWVLLSKEIAWYPESKQVI